MADDRYIPPHLQRSRNPQYRTPIEELDYHYKNKMGVFQTRSSPTPDLEPGAVRRGAGDIWSRVRDELRNIKQGTGIMGRGFADAASEVGRTTGVTQFGQGAIKAGKEVGQVLQRLNMGPQGDTWMTFNDPYGKKKFGEGPPLAASHAPVVPTTEKGAPASTYERGEGAPTGTTRRQEQITAGAPPGGIRQQSTGNKYLDMYYASAAAQKKYLGGLPENQAPIEVIRGTKQSYWSPTTNKEYNTRLEAAFGQEHKTEMARLIGKETAAAKQRPYPYQFVKTTDPDTWKETINVVDPNTGKVLPDSKIDPDLQAVQARYPSFIKGTPEEQDQELAKMPSQQRQLLIKMIRQLAQEQGGK